MAKKLTPNQKLTLEQAQALIGLQISVDVSTDDETAGHRIFAEIQDIQQSNDGGYDMLAVETSRNFGPVKKKTRK